MSDQPINDQTAQDQAMNDPYRFITLTQGSRLFYRQTLPATPKALVIISHGYGEHSGFYLKLMEFLDAEGYGVYALDHRGHGRSEEERGHLERFGLFVEDLDALINVVRERHPGLPVFTFAHSMGGLIAFAYGILHPEKLRGQVFSGAAVGRPAGTEWVPGWVFPFLKRFFNRFKIYPVLSQKGTRNLEIRKYSGGDPLVLKYATVGFFHEFIHQGIGFVQERAASYRLPCLFLHGTADRIIPYRASVDMVEKISSPDKAFKLYEGLYHELIQEPERDQVLADILTWLNQRAGGR